MTRMTKRLEDGNAAMDCIACAKQGVVCSLLSCRNRLKNRICDYEDVMQSNALVKQNRGRWMRLDAHKGIEQFKCSICRSECYVPTCMNEPMYDYCPTAVLT